MRVNSGCYAKSPKFPSNSEQRAARLSSLTRWISIVLLLAGCTNATPTAAPPASATPASAATQPSGSQNVTLYLPGMNKELKIL